MGRRANGEGSIYKRSDDGRWCASILIERGKRRYFYGRTRQQVVQRLAEARRALDLGLPLAGDRLTCGSYLETWLRDSVARQVRPRTLRRYQEIVRLHLVPALGRVPLSKLTPQQVGSMLNEMLASGLSPRTAHHCRAILRTALNVAMRWGLVGRNVAALAAPPHVPEPEVRPLSPSDARAVLRAMEGHRLEALVTVALAVGLRQGEALGLQWGDVDLDGARLSVRRTIQRIGGTYQFMEPKTRRSNRVVSLPIPVVSALREHRARQLAQRLRVGAAWQGSAWGDLVFADEVGSPLSATGVTRRFQSRLAEAGLPRMRYHDLRHGCASLLAAQGVPVRVAMELLGHSSITTTMNIYAHVAPEFQQDAAERMTAALWAEK